MTTLLQLLVGILTVKIAILGCDPSKCTPEIKDSILSQVSMMEQYVNAQLDVLKNATTTVDTPQTSQPSPSPTPSPSPAPSGGGSAAASPAPEPQPAPNFVGSISASISTSSPSNVVVAFSWATDIPTTGQFYLCTTRINNKTDCGEQVLQQSFSSDTQHSFTIERPKNLVEFYKITAVANGQSIMSVGQMPQE